MLGWTPPPRRTTVHFHVKIVNNRNQVHLQDIPKCSHPCMICLKRHFCPRQKSPKRGVTGASGDTTGMDICEGLEAGPRAQTPPQRSTCHREQS